MHQSPEEYMDDANLKPVLTLVQTITTVQAKGNILCKLYMTKCVHKLILCTSQWFIILCKSHLFEEETINRKAEIKYLKAEKNNCDETVFAYVSIYKYFTSKFKKKIHNTKQ